jgi:hypothetical protein
MMGKENKKIVVKSFFMHNNKKEKREGRMTERREKV